MTQRIDVPGVGIVEFPDSMNDDQITNAIKTNIIPNYQSKTAPKEIPIDRTKSSFDQAIQENPIIQGLGAIGTGAGKTISNSIGGLIDLAGRGVGAISPNAGQAMQDFAAKNQALAEQQNAPYQEQYPILNTTGQVAGYAAPFTGALKAVKAVAPVIPGVRALANPVTSLGRAGEAALAGGTTGALTTPGDVGTRAEEAGMQGAMAGAGQLALPWLAGVAKGAYNKYLGIEAPRMYNPNTGVPLDARGSTQYSQATRMPPEVQQAYPNAQSVPAPGTAGQQTGSRLYDYATSLRPWTDLIGGSTGVPLGGLIGEIPALSKVPGFKSQGLPEIGLKAIPEAFQSNKLQGLVNQPTNNLGGAVGGAPVAGPVRPNNPPPPPPASQPQAPQPSSLPPAQAAQVAAANRIINAPPIATPTVTTPQPKINDVLAQIRAKANNTTLPSERWSPQERQTLQQQLQNLQENPPAPITSAEETVMKKQTLAPNNTVNNEIISDFAKNGSSGKIDMVTQTTPIDISKTAYNDSNATKGMANYLIKNGVDSIPRLEGMTESQIINAIFKQMTGNRTKK